jgi:hypothetical protein
MESYGDPSTGLLIPNSKLIVFIFISLGFVEVAAESVDDEKEKGAS